jgi:hypothetical protein
MFIAVLMRDTLFQDTAFWVSSLLNALCHVIFDEIQTGSRCHLKHMVNSHLKCGHGYFIRSSSSSVISPWLFLYRWYRVLSPRW